jgi:hypothetical protein
MAIEPTHILLPAELCARLARAAIILAQREAEKHVKRQIAAAGKKLALTPKRDITAAAKDYLAAHPELIAQQRPVVERWRVEGVFGKRAARRIAQNSQVLCKSESPAACALPLLTTHEPIGGAI